jgi:hypothetical protein
MIDLQTYSKLNLTEFTEQLAEAMVAANLAGRYEILIESAEFAEPINLIHHLYLAEAMIAANLAGRYEVLEESSIDFLETLDFVDPRRRRGLHEDKSLERKAKFLGWQKDSRGGYTGRYFIDRYGRWRDAETGAWVPMPDREPDKQENRYNRAKRILQEEEAQRRRLGRRMYQSPEPSAYPKQSPHSPEKNKKKGERLKIRRTDKELNSLSHHDTNIKPIKENEEKTAELIKNHRDILNEINEVIGKIPNTTFMPRDAYQRIYDKADELFGRLKSNVEEAKKVLGKTKNEELELELNKIASVSRETLPGTFVHKPRSIEELDNSVKKSPC